MIDANASLREAFGRMIDSRLPYVSIEGASNRAEGLMKARTLAPCLVFIDIHLPDHGSLEFVRSIKKIHPGTTIVAFAGYDLPECRSALCLSGVDQCIPKDAWSGEEMLALVKSVVSVKDDLQTNS